MRCLNCWARRPRRDQNLAGRACHASTARLCQIAVFSMTNFFRTSNKSSGGFIAAVLLTSAFAACSTAVPASNDADLEARVQAWWSARQSGDVTRMYALLEPSFRAKTTLSEFGVNASRLRSIAVENPRTVSVSMIPDSRRAMVALVAQTRLTRTGKLVDIDIRDEWVLEGGQWWRVYVAPRTPFE